MRIVIGKNAFMPTRAYETDAGLDLYSPIDITVPARGSAIIDTGVHIQLPKGTAGMIKSKSGLNVKHDITSEGVVDVGYVGSMVVKLYNNGDTDYHVQRGDKISQLVIVQIVTPHLMIVDKLDDSERGENGFGSTGR